MTTAIAWWRGLAKAISYPQAGPAQNERYRRYPNDHRDVPKEFGKVIKLVFPRNHAPRVRPRGVSQPADPRGPHHRKHQPQSKKSSSPVHGCFGCMVMPALWRLAGRPGRRAGGPAREAPPGGAKPAVLPAVVLSAHVGGARNSGTSGNWGLSEHSKLNPIPSALPASEHVNMGWRHSHPAAYAMMIMTSTNRSMLQLNGSA
jgi:hypothetical protein